MELEKKIDLVKDLITFIQSENSHQNEDDIRSITTYSFYQISESFLIALILSENISDIKYCKEKINQDIEIDGLENLEYVFDGFIKDSYFIKIFVLVENHFKQIAEFYESRPNNSMNVDSINQTFNNLLNPNKTTLFTILTNQDKELFEFYCFLRNTIHNIGFQLKDTKQLKINDPDSIINQNEVIIDLTQNSVNSLDFEKLILLHEQVFKLIFKMNDLIPGNDFIGHRLVSIGFNEN
jgi:hypothetical protein